MTRPGVLLVTGAYYPEISAAGVQCRAVAAALGERVRCSVLATAVNEALPAEALIDGVPVHRVAIDVRSLGSKVAASIRLARSMFRWRGTFDVVHLHGVSSKNVAVTLLARALRKPVVLTLHTAGQDEPNVVRASGRLASWAFASADVVLSVSAHLTERYRAAALPETRLRTAPNGVDVERFRPLSAERRLEQRRALGLPGDRPIVLFVGFFSHDKRPDLLFRAWRDLLTIHRIDATLVYVGAIASSYYEVDRSIADEIQSGAAALGRADRVIFVPPTDAVDQYFQVADVFVLPSAREANPLALLEAMSCALPCVASRLPGATDAIVDDGVNGRLCPVDDDAAFASAIADMLHDAGRAADIGARARDTIRAHFDVRRTAEAWLAAYHDALGARR